MPMSPSRKYRRNLAFVAIAFVVFGGAAAYRHAVAARVEVSDASGVVACRMGDFRYEYHAPSGSECLFDLARDPRCVTNVLRENEKIAAECRARLEKELGVPSLETLRARYADTIRRLQALGYL
jgi:hypothetical protein